ncbi:hypothetical protein PBY51_008731 [Eleginops maclovinus]|uniref:Uncharacterized protein n=1 Tax=Eleginops maclovinus TaxID=56733 RepID=A0AAN8ABN8_ELEMC|nr:hypothetical protein PBY51_008731 [Eleginops maclovinus]
MLSPNGYCWVMKADINPDMSGSTETCPGNVLYLHFLSEHLISHEPFLGRLLSPNLSLPSQTESWEHFLPKCSLEADWMMRLIVSGEGGVECGGA